MSRNTTASGSGTTSASSAGSTSSALPLSITALVETAPSCMGMRFSFTGSAVPLSFNLLDASYRVVVPPRGDAPVSTQPNGTWVIIMRVADGSTAYLEVVDARGARATSGPVRVTRGPSDADCVPRKTVSVGAIAGAVLAAVVVLLVMYCLVRRRRQRARWSAEAAGVSARVQAASGDNFEIARLNSRAAAREERLGLMSAAAPPAAPARPAAPPRRLTGEPDPDDVAPPYSPADATKYPPPPVYHGLGAAGGPEDGDIGEQARPAQASPPRSPPPPLTPLSPRRT
ncbi:hypothetical protein Q8F55_001291 [Vanrija albida]|uniref:Uncharacterized protein n=1 Tax=Vanrija albida TaxID=181172 RepID=A0ABR3QFT4_9TREE